MEKKKITEEMGEHKAWMVTAKNMTAAELPEFIRHLIEDYEHDYGTICHAIAAAAIAGAYAVERSPQGGITGFQAGAIMWEMIKGWGVFGDGPMRMTCFNDMLYPQYAYKFKSISPDTWDYLREKAEENLEEEGAHPDVVAHWKKIAAGIVPFGYSIEKEN